MDSDEELIEIIHRGSSDQRLCTCSHFQWWHHCKPKNDDHEMACCADKCHCQIFTDRNTFSPNSVSHFLKEG